MKYLKKYENLNKPQINDYVICEDQDYTNGELVDFISKNVGKIVAYTKDYEKIEDVFAINYPYIVKYENIPEKLNGLEFGDYLAYTRVFSDSEILYHSNNKEDVEKKLSLLRATNKYNL